MLIKRLKLKNLLSFGPEGVDLELRPLNVLIGPNGSGKSNLIEAIGLLREIPRDLSGCIRQGGGISQWLWRGGKGKNLAEIETRIVAGRRGDLMHYLGLGEFANDEQFRVYAERIARVPSEISRQNGAGSEYHRAAHTTKIANSHGDIVKRYHTPASFKETESLVTQLKEPSGFSELRDLAEAYEGITIFREWTMGPRNPVRQWQDADQRSTVLRRDFSNVALVLNRMRRAPTVKRRLIELVTDFMDGARDFDVAAEANRVLIFLDESEFSVSATRLSDGTLRYLGLLAILLDPEPPPLVCIDEPELGLHADAVAALTDLIIDASERMQLIVTTHSDILVDALSHRPEDVVVCDRRNGVMSMKRLEKPRLAVLLKEHSLGLLWSRGDIGGNRS